MRKLLVASAVVVVGWAVLAMSSGAQDDAKKVTIKEVMKVAMKGKLADKVAKGQATEEEKKKLAGLFAALHENMPPKGDQSDWSKRTKELVDAANDVLAGKAGSSDVLAAKAADCMGCHKAHK